MKRNSDTSIFLHDKLSIKHVNTFVGKREICSNWHIFNGLFINPLQIYFNDFPFMLNDDVDIPKRIHGR